MRDRKHDLPACRYRQISLLSFWEDHSRLYYCPPDITRRKRQAVVAPQQSLSVVQLWNACLHALADMDAVDAIITARKKERIVWCVLDLETESGLFVAVQCPPFRESHKCYGQSHRPNLSQPTDCNLAGLHSVSSNPIRRQQRQAQETCH